MGKKCGVRHKGKRVGLYKMEEQICWLQRKADDHGFAILSAMPFNNRRLKDVIPTKDGKSALQATERIATKDHHDAKFFSVQFDGTLQVTDPERFLAAIQSGIGSGKALGFGLLSVAAARG